MSERETLVPIISDRWIEPFPPSSGSVRNSVSLGSGTHMCLGSKLFGVEFLLEHLQMSDVQTEV